MFCIFFIQFLFSAKKGVWPVYFNIKIYIILFNALTQVLIQNIFKYGFIDLHSKKCFCQCPTKLCFSEWANEHIFLVIYKNYLIAYLQIYFSNLNNLFINEKIWADSIIRKQLVIPKFFLVLVFRVYMVHTYSVVTNIFLPFCMLFPKSKVWTVMKSGRPIRVQYSVYISISARPGSEKFSYLRTYYSKKITYSI